MYQSLDKKTDAKYFRERITEDVYRGTNLARRLAWGPVDTYGLFCMLLDQVINDEYSEVTVGPWGGEVKADENCPLFTKSRVDSNFYNISELVWDEVDYRVALELPCPNGIDNFNQPQKWTGETRTAVVIASGDDYPLLSDYPGLISFDRETMMVEYYASYKHLLADRRTKTRLGRYLNKLNWEGGKVADTVNRVNVFLNLVSEGEVKWARTGDEIEHVYINGPSSCMSRSDFHSVCHPSRVYESPDIAIAYVEVDDRIVARTVVDVREDYKNFLPAYGNFELLHSMLERDGYTQDSDFDGARLAVIDDPEFEYVMPYLDTYNQSVGYDGGWWIIGGGKYECCHTYGGLNEGRCCEHCDSYHSEDEVNYYSDLCMDICNSCLASDFTYLSYCARYVNNNDITDIDGERVYDIHVEYHHHYGEYNGYTTSNEELDERYQEEFGDAEAA